MVWSFVSFAPLLIIAVTAQPSGVTCPTTGADFAGLPQYQNGPFPMAAPLRGNVGCVDAAAKALRASGGGVNIFGPMENGFASSGTGPGVFTCLNEDLIGGLDTAIADKVMAFQCSDPGEMASEILDYCGGHTRTYHYHQSMSCIYQEDADTGHSTRVGTAADGRGIYGKFIEGGVVPTDLDLCNGRTGTNPDSPNVAVYYYVITDEPPFTVGCFGPVADLAACRTLYTGCSASAVSLTTEYGTGQYHPDCPCFDDDGSNVEGQGRPGFLVSLTDGTAEPTKEPTKAGAEVTSEPTSTSASFSSARTSLASVSLLAVASTLIYLS